MKKLITICAAALAFAVIAADTDCGALITTGNIADSAKVENLTGANAGKATITINDNSGTANSVTVYNAATVDTALSGKASTGDITALQTRATALETATNNLTAAAAAAQSTADAALPKSGGTMTGDLIISGANVYWSFGNDFMSPTVGPDGIGLRYRYAGTDYNLMFPGSSGDRAALLSDIPTETDPTVPSWAKAASKPSYNFSEIGSRPTTLSGYGITDAKIANGTITLGSNSITPLTSYTETDPTALKPSQLKVNGTAMTTASAAVELGQYYVKTVDGKPHLFLRN